MKEIMQTYGAMIVAVVVGIALLSGFGALKNKMSVAFAPQDILSSDSANDSYDSMKNIPVPGIELKEKMRQNAVSYSVYDLLDVTAHEDNLDKLEVYALYDSGRNDCTGSISADGSSLSLRHSDTEEQKERANAVHIADIPKNSCMKSMA